MDIRCSNHHYVAFAIKALFAGAYVASVKPGSQYDAGTYVASVASSLVHNYDAGAYVASVASSLVHNMTLELM